MLEPVSFLLSCACIGVVVLCSALFLPPDPPTAEDEFQPLPETEHPAGEPNTESAHQPDRIATLGTRVSVIMYLAACALPCLRFGEGQPGICGGLCLIFLPFVLFTPYWYANPAFWWGLAAHSVGKRSTAAASALLAAFLASTFFATQWIEPLAGEPNRPHCLVGSWLWLGSLWLFAGCAWRNATRDP
jgi:hypothetical protein